MCVNNEDVIILVKLLGVGKKIVECLVFEMKDRFKNWGNDLFMLFSDNVVIEFVSNNIFVVNNVVDDVVLVFEVLGYKLL